MIRLRSPSRPGRLTVACLFLWTTAGCGGSGPDLVGVTGTLRLDGKPLPGAQVTFIPQEKGKSPAYGITDNDGYYRLKFSRDRVGAMPGLNNVTVQLPSKREQIDMRAAGLSVPPDGVKLPEKYGVPGALTAEVESYGGDFDFDLQSN